MNYVLLLRKLVINGNIYYQTIDKAIGNINELDYIELGENKEKVNIVDKIKNGETGYFEIDQELYDAIDVSKNKFFKFMDNTILEIDNFQEANEVALEFFKTFKDFKLIPDFNMEEIINNTKLNIENKVIEQSDAVDRILKKIYNNQIFFESDLDYLDKKNNKSNILLMGPFGSGKTTIKEIIKESINDIPIVEYKLTGDFKKDMIEIVKRLLLQTDGNIYLAERGIVIFDGINAFSSSYLDDDYQSINIYIDTLLRVLECNNLNIQFSDGNYLNFNYSLITNFCIVDIDYDHNENNKDNSDIYYSRINPESFLELGFTPEILINHFDNEVIYMKEMDYDLAYKILKNKDISPLYKMKKTLENKGKVVKISNDFVDSLIDYSLSYNEGFLGITKILKYLLQSKNINNKTIYFRSSDIDELKIGSVLPSFEDEYLVEDKENTNFNDKLKVDLSKKTINNLTRKDVINLIKENIKGQDEQIFDIVNSFYEFVFNKHKKFNLSEYKKIKDNILIIGSTGVGKTAIIENLVEIFDIPFKREDATRYSGTGIVGDDVSSMLKDLVEVCNGDVKSAEQGIIFIDEIDKIASSNANVDIGRDVQNALLTLIEGNKITIRPEVREMFEPYVFDTSNVLFIAAGAFEEIDLIKNLRVKKEKTGSSLGFKTNDDKKYINEDITISDLTNYGMSTQLMARLSNVIHLNSLNEDILLDIIENSKDGYVNLKRKSYEFEGVKINLSDGFKKKLALLAYHDKKGARSIKTVFKRVLNEIDKNIIDSDIEEVILDDNSLDDFKSIQYIKKK